ncbi:MAG: discoidin domain-containing protein [Deltaproteobacteria bacterium]|nr:discoidin domain-containing protein [Deltaproteobacteria bacterium]
MRNKVICLVSFVLAIGGVAQATFETVGVYDPDDGPHSNQVDQSGMYDSHTANAGPANVIDLAAFQALIGPAFDADGGGVVDAESANGGLDGQDIIANFGINSTKSATFTNTVGSISRGSGGGSGNRLPISGNQRFAKDATTGDFEFDVSAVTGGALGEVVTHFGATLLYRDNRDMNPQVTATFSGGGAVTAVADMLMNAPSNSKDTFFGFVAPPGQGIVNVTFDLASWTHLDDLAFITSAFVVVSAEASNPKPANGATDAPRGVALNWMPGELADTHDVYLGLDEQAVADADVSDATGIYRGRVDVDRYNPEVFDFDKTYYWRVDEVDGTPDNTVHKGDVWSFRTEQFSYEVLNVTATASSSAADKGPENAVNGAGLDSNGLHSNIGEGSMWLSDIADPQPAWIQFEFDSVRKLDQMLVWNSNESLEMAIGLGFKDTTIEYSTDGVEFATLGTTHEFAQAPGTAGYANNTTINMGGIGAKFVKLTANSGWKDILPQFGLSEVQFWSIPVQARNPEPAAMATDVALNPVLSWIAGREAVSHQVYFSDNFQAVMDGTADVTTVDQAIYGPLSLDLGKTYYWRIVEINDAESPAGWQGDIWDFTTIESLVLDNIESYNDIDPPDPDSNRIFESWIDGFGVATNGALIGNDYPPYSEQTIVHGGNQSMPFFYENSAGNSEATLTLTSQRDWTVSGIKQLSIWFRGYPASAGGFAEGAAGTYTITAAGADIWDVADEFHYAYKQFSGTGSIVARIDSLDNTDPFAKAGVMIRETLDADSAYVSLLITPANGIRFQYRQAPGNVTDRDFVDGLAAPYWVKLERDAGGGFRGSYSTDGVNWEAMALRPSVPMATSIYVGLAVTSHNVAVTAQAVFSGVQIAGTVAGQWQSQDIGILNNSAEPMYVALANSNGTSGVALYDDPAASQTDTWTEWRIDLQQFADQGVNLSDVDSITIGLGDNTPGGAGIMYFDDLGLFPEPPAVVAKRANSAIEAEAADILGVNWRLYNDAASSGRRHIGSDEGDGNDNDTAPGAEWHASYNFTAATDGVYKILLRGQEAGADSFWVRITTATSQTLEDPDQPGTGWVRFNGMDAPSGWAWDEVHSDDDPDRAVVNWTLAAGEHTLEIAKREDGVILDAIMITDDLALDQTTLP